MSVSTSFPTGHSLASTSPVSGRRAASPSFLSTSTSTSTSRPGSLSTTLRQATSSLQMPSPTRAVALTLESPQWSAEGSRHHFSSGDSLELPMLHRRANAVSLTSHIEESTEFVRPSSPGNDSSTDSPITSRSLPRGGDSSAVHPRSFRWSPRYPSVSLDSDPGTPASTQTTRYSRAPLNLGHISEHAQAVAAQHRYVLRPPRVVHALPGASSPGDAPLLWAVRDTDAVDKVLVPPDEHCAICLEPLRTGERVQPMVRCPHLFHEGCIQELVQAVSEEARRVVPIGQAFADRVRCPLCRGSLAASNLSDVPQEERDSVVVLSALEGSSADEEMNVGSSFRRGHSLSLTWDAFHSGSISGFALGLSGSFTDSTLIETTRSLESDADITDQRL